MFLTCATCWKVAESRDLPRTLGTYSHGKSSLRVVGLRVRFLKIKHMLGLGLSQTVNAKGFCSQCISIGQRDSQIAPLHFWQVNFFGIGSMDGQ